MLSLLGEGHGPGRRKETEGTERFQLRISREGASEITGTAADPTLRPTNQKWVNLSLKRVSRVCDGAAHPYIYVIGKIEGSDIRRDPTVGEYARILRSEKIPMIYKKIQKKIFEVLRDTL